MKKSIKSLLLVWSVLFWIVIASTAFWFKLTNMTWWTSIFSKNTNPDKIQIIDEKNTKQAYFAWGCFWCMEWIFEWQEGVSQAIAGYIGGSSETAVYSEVGGWKTKHREGVEVQYDPTIIEYARLVELFWTQIDPVDAEGQFADRWYQYTTAIFYDSQEEKTIAEASKKALGDSGKFTKDIATLILPVSEFFKAEEYHQDYYKKSSLRYKLYKKWSGREWFIDENWTQRIAELNEKTYSDASLRERLTPLQYKVTQQGGTERAFNNEYWDNKEPWIYVDIIDGTALYSSLDKYVSGTGWPSFTKPISDEVVSEHEDKGLFYTRTEIKSTSSNSHVWHAFPDGPEDKWGLRYCMNSAAMRFIPLDRLEEEGYGEYLEMFE